MPVIATMQVTSTPGRLRAPRRALATAVALTVAAIAAAALAAPASAAFGISQFKGSVVDGSGDPFTQAGGHPFSASTTIAFDTAPDEAGGETADGQVKDIDVELPPGFVGNPAGVPTCSDDLLVDPEFFNGTVALCPVNTQVGTVAVRTGSTSPDSSGLDVEAPIFNLEPAGNEPARFAFNYVGVVVTVVPELRSDGDYGLTVRTRGISEFLFTREIVATFWGVPSDPAHDAERGDNCFLLFPFCPRDAGGPPGDGSASTPTGLPPRPFLTNPGNCSAGPLTTRLRVESWNGEVDTASFDVDADNGDAPMAVENCEAMPFTPSVSLQPTTRRAGAPSGLDVELTVPQTGLDNPDGIASAHLKRVAVTLPEGMTVNPASANGLGACSPAQIGLDDRQSPSCPASSKIGAVEVATPLLDEPLEGAVYLAEQGSNPFGSLLALYVVVEGRGMVVKLPGRVTPDPDTGRLRAVFDNNPQLPFSRLSVRFKSGDRAPLTTPQACGTYEIATELSSWAAADPDAPTAAETVSASDSFTIDQGCGASGFAPGFVAGSTSPIAGAFSPFALRVTRDGGKEIGRIETTLPQGMLASLRDVEVCTGAQLATAAGKPGRVAQSAPSCPAGSQVGTTTVGAGSGPTPFFPTLPGTSVSGRVFLTAPHTGTQFPRAGVPQADYGLAVEVPAVAGPFDLGTVMVRAAIYVDPSTARLTVVSDRLPRILQGIPLDVRDVRVNVDRERFAINPTSCAEQRAVADVLAQDGTAARRDSRFQVADCRSLRFQPRLGLRLTGKRQTRTGGHPGIRAVVRQSGVGEAGIGRAVVRLPRSLALDPDNAQALCEFEDGTKPDLEDHCPAGSIVGRARAATPLLKRPLVGNVYFVKNVRVDPETGNRIRTLPMIVVALRGEVDVNLRGTSSVRGGRLVNTFAAVPDAPISRFNLNLAGGADGILAVTRTARAEFDLCAGRHVARAVMSGQNGARRGFGVRVKTPCAAKRRRG